MQTDKLLIVISTCAKSSFMYVPVCFGSAVNPVPRDATATTATAPPQKQRNAVIHGCAEVVYMIRLKTEIRRAEPPPIYVCVLHSIKARLVVSNMRSYPYYPRLCLYPRPV